MCESKTVTKSNNFEEISKLYESGIIEIVSRNTDSQKYMMNLAFMASKQSSCSRHKVGALLSALDKTIISTGFNGTNSGSNHCADIAKALESAGFNNEWHESGDHRHWSANNEKHAEFNMFRFANALFNVDSVSLEFADNNRVECNEFANYVDNVSNIFGADSNEYFSTVYITHFPCVKCAKLIAMYCFQYSIEKVYFSKLWYNHIDDINETIKILSIAGIEIIQLLD